jgi:hypothetical protein
VTVAFLLMIVLLAVPVAVADRRRGVQPFDRLGRHLGTDGRNG